METITPTEVRPCVAGNHILVSFNRCQCGFHPRPTYKFAPLRRAQGPVAPSEQAQPVAAGPELVTVVSSKLDGADGLSVVQGNARLSLVEDPDCEACQ